MPRFRDPKTGQELFWCWERADRMFEINKLKDEVLRP